MTRHPHRGRVALLSRAAYADHLTENERRLLVRYGAPNVSEEVALDLIAKARHLATQQYLVEAMDLIDRLADGNLEDGER